MHRTIMESTLKKYMGYSVFREYQKEIIENILQKKDCLVVMATGSGKSLCYQIPPLILEKTGVVISPLLSLMQDQVMMLQQRGIKADYLASTQTDSTVQSKAERGYFNILYMTPEKACSLSLSFWTNLQGAGVCLVAIDEAHCISEWGHDFRVEYKQLDKLRDILLNVPFVGLTATATEKVRADIISSLKMNDPYITIGSFDRKNLFYGAKSFNRGLSFVDEIVEEIKKFVITNSSTIIYCTTIKDVMQISEALQAAGIKAGIYHGQMAKQDRQESHRLFVRDELQIMVATIAFGMGIDKPNIRYVINYGCPKSLETYYQESGRCGRDGIASECWLYYSRSDFAKADFYCGEANTESQKKAIVQSLKAAQSYCMVTSCRRKFLLSHFGENVTSDKCGNCDNCTTTKGEVDMAKEAYLLLACIRSCDGRWGLNMPVDVLRGSHSKKVVNAKFDKLPLHGLGKTYSSNWWKDLGYQLISQGYLVETVNNLFTTVSVGPKGMQFLSLAKLDQQPPLNLPRISAMDDDKKNCKSIPGVDINNSMMDTSQHENFTKDEEQLYDLLLQERMKLARVVGTAPYAICGDQTVKKIVLSRPSTKARLANIDGVNQHLLATHGDYLIQTIRDLSQRLNLSLDGDEGRKQTFTARTNQPVSNQPHKSLSPAKFEAWKMWCQGLSVKQIANLPGRSAPIKEQTVINYLFDAAQEGCEIDWARLCDEIGLTSAMFSNIDGAILKVGSRDKLKPIKDELPENISYEHIKASIAMHNCGVTIDTFSSSQSHTELSPKKRQKIDEPDEEKSILVEATESSMLDWLKNHDGFLVSDIVEYFGGSSEEHVMNLLNILEGELLIFKKNNRYMIL